jgi:hypothetical protein
MLAEKLMAAGGSGTGVPSASTEWDVSNAVYNGSPPFAAFYVGDQETSPIWHLL